MDRTEDVSGKSSVRLYGWWEKFKRKPGNEFIVKLFWETIIFPSVSQIIITKELLFPVNWSTHHRKEHYKDPVDDLQ